MAPNINVYLNRKVWPGVRALILQIVLASGVIAGAGAIFIFTILVDWSNLLDIEFRGKTLSTISSDGLILALLIMNVVNGLIIVIAWRLFERRSFQDMLLSSIRSSSGALLLGAAAGFAETIVVYTLLSVTGLCQSEWSFHPRFSSWAVVWFATSCIIAPCSEEMLYRGYWFQNIRNGWGVWPAVLAGATCFAGFHLLNPNANILGAINIDLHAVVYVQGMLYVGSLWFPIGWHSSWNFTQFFICGLPNSGLSANNLGLSGATLLNSTVQGNEWITGGTFGLEASLLKSLTSLCIILVFVWLIRKGHAICILRGNPLTQKAP